MSKYKTPKTAKNPKGAGPKPKPKSEHRQRTQVSLSPVQMAKFRKLGASKFLQKKIDEEECE